MTRTRYHAQLVLAVGALIPAQSICAQACLTTRPSTHAFVPPQPYSSDASPGSFWYGTDSLWTSLDVSGKWEMRDNVLHGNGYRTKLIYWQQGFKWQNQLQLPLLVTARRLDNSGLLVTAEQANVVYIPSREYPSMMTAINIPQAGCWELTADYRGQVLSFTVSVVP